MVRNLNGGISVDEKSLGVKIGEARRAAGLTQQQLCQKSGLSYSTLAKIERGAIKSPSVFTIQQIAVALGTSLDSLVGAGKAQAPVLAKKRSKSGVEFVYFDVNGCMVRFFHRAFSDVTRDTGVPADIVEMTYWHYTDAVCRGEMSMEDFNKASAKKFKVASIDWGKYYLGAIEPIAETKELVAWAAKHYKIGLLTNIMPGMLEAMIKSHTISNVGYDAVVDSSKVGAIKPEAAIYDEATKQAGVEPERILLIDDSRANLMAAEQRGWRVLWFDDYRPKETLERVKSALEF